MGAAQRDVTAATMIASGFTGVDDFLSGKRNLLTRSGGGDKPRAGRTHCRRLDVAAKFQKYPLQNGGRPVERCTLATRVTLSVRGIARREHDRNRAAACSPPNSASAIEIMNTSIKKWTVGSPLQSVLDAVAILLEDPAVRAGKIKRIVVDMPADRLHIVDNRTISDICLQHLVAMMIVDGGATFDSIHDAGPHERPQGAGGPQAGRGSAESGTGDRGAGAPGHRENRDHRRPHAQPSHL